MTYSEVLSGIHGRKRFSQPTLDRIRRLMAALGDPQEQFRVVHVAGTNGKGSVSAMIHEMLVASGYKTGLFTSPYLKEFRERIRICGENIPEEDLISCYETVMEAELALEQEGFEPINEFELVTAMGFLAFSRAGVEFVVLEVGLGGKSDPTNLIAKPAVCVIMPISLDHTAVLGDTVAQIAGEKAGIIKECCPLVLAKQPEDAKQVFCETAKVLHAPVYEAEAVIPVAGDKFGSRFCVGEREVFLPLLGSHQMDNAAVALKAAEVLGLDMNTCAKALSHVSWPGRLQYFPGTPEFLVDAGHNPAGIESLCDALDRLFDDKTIIAILAMLKDKDFDTCIPAIASRSRAVIGTTVGQPRSMTPDEICQEGAAYCPAFPAENMQQAIELAKTMATEQDLILICGSVYAAGDALLVLDP